MPTAEHPENYPCVPINPYGASKWMIERVLHADYRVSYGFGSFALRYFNAAGADPAGGIGEMRDVETHLIPRAMMALQGHVPDFAVFGDDYDTSDGTAIRDYIHVTDLAAAHVLALKLLLGDIQAARSISVPAMGYRYAKSSQRSRPGRRTSRREVRHVIEADAPVIRPPGRRSLRRASDAEFPRRPFGSGHDHPHRLGVAQEGSPAEDG